MLFALSFGLIALTLIPSRVTAAPPGIPTLTQMRANSDVMDLTLIRTGAVMTLVDGVPDSRFVGMQIAYYVNGQYYGPNLGTLHPLPGTRLSVIKLILKPADNPTHFWELRPNRKANVVLAVSDPDGPRFQAQHPERCFLPDWYQDAPEFRPTKYAPKFTLIENKLNAGLLKRNDVTWQDAISRAGLTHISAEHVIPQSLYDPIQGVRYGLPNSDIFAFAGKTRGSDLTRAEVRKAAEGFGPFGLLGDQFGEGRLGFPEESDQEFWFYERAREIASDPKVTWQTIFFGTYGSFGNYILRNWHGPYGDEVSPSNLYFRKYYETPALTLTSCSYFGRMYQVADANVSWYPADFAYAQDFYRRIHSIQVMKLGQAQKAPKRHTFLFWWPGIEAVDNGSLHNGYHWEHATRSPPGTAWYEEHPCVDFNTALGLCLFGGFIVGDGVIGWDNNLQFDPDPDIVGRDEAWTPATPDKAVRRSEHYGYAAHPVNILSAQLVAAQWYQTCARTTGSPWQYARYRVDGGPWVLPESNGSTILMRAADADRNRQGIAFARVRGHAVDWAFQNPLWLPGDQHTVTVGAAGRSWSQRVRGNELVLCHEREDVP